MLNIRKICLLLLLALAVHAVENVLLEQRFEKPGDLAEWRLTQLPVLEDSNFASTFAFQEEEGRIFLHTSNKRFFARLLNPELEVNDQLLAFIITVEMRNQTGPNVLSFALTDEPYYFDHVFRSGPRDTGVQVCGYQHPNSHNFLRVRHFGEDVFCRPSLKPYNFLEANENHKWVTWKLRYDNVEHRLEFYRANDTKPFLTQFGVDINGAKLKRFFLKCDGNDYRYVKITALRK